jgi:hypothetical protein
MLYYLNNADVSILQERNKNDTIFNLCESVLLQSSYVNVWRFIIYDVINMPVSQERNKKKVIMNSKLTAVYTCLLFVMCSITIATLPASKLHSDIWDQQIKFVKFKSLYCRMVILDWLSSNMFCSFETGNLV